MKLTRDAYDWLLYRKALTVATTKAQRRARLAARLSPAPQVKRNVRRRPAPQ